jgi:ABC-2 type transport system permease protein
MILTVFQVSLLRLWNNKHELLLVFIVPVLFFSIFALIFSRGVGQTSKQVRVSVINDDDSQLTRDMADGLLAMKEMQGVTGIGRTDQQWSLDRLARLLMTRRGAEIVIYFPAGYAASLETDDPLSVQILNEGTNPISSQLVEAGLSHTIAVHAGEAKLQKIAPQPAAANDVRLASATSRPIPNSSDIKSQSGGLAEASTWNPVRFESHDVFASNKHQPKIAMYAAGIAVMFLLFSASGAGASLLEEKEAGTFERLMCSKLHMSELLLGKWIYMLVLGMVQITTMFAWGQLVFDVDLLGHLPGFLIMASATAAASASFALFLASVCRSRTQLNAVSVVVVLGMSALGGSMIPRYLMSESMQRLGRFTFNGWALDGFKKIFWYDQPVSAIRTEVLVLVMIAMVLGFFASILVRRWSVA